MEGGCLQNLTSKDETRRTMDTRETKNEKKKREGGKAATDEKKFSRGSVEVGAVDDALVWFVTRACNRRERDAAKTLRCGPVHSINGGRKRGASSCLEVECLSVRSPNVCTVKTLRVLVKS